MAGFILPVDPIILQVGPLVVRWYGVMIALAILAGCYLGLKEAERRGISRDEVLNLVTWAVPLGFVGARLFHVVDLLPYYMANPIKIFALNEGGMAIYGALVGGVLAGFIYARVRSLPVGKLADAAAPGLILGQAIGRLGCFFNGDHQGVVAIQPGSTREYFPWATMYTNPNTVVPDFGVPRHPTQVYEGLFDLAVFGLLWWLRPRIPIDGVLFWTYASLYSFGRFWISFLRLDNEFLLGLKEAQFVSLITFMVGVPLMVYLLSRYQRGLATAQRPAVDPG